ELNEFVGEIDISADGKYIAAGTSGSVYFFETIVDNAEEIECTEIIEPEPEKATSISNSNATEEPQVGKPEKQAPLLLIVIFGSAFLVLVIGLIIYLVISKRKKR
ncbi:MAG: hypothetical protein H8E13_18290, partial [Actinobacteria bacterium]|nr:hypothetical protein [Actinomycetota bacterium]